MKKAVVFTLIVFASFSTAFAQIDALVNETPLTDTTINFFLVQVEFPAMVIGFEVKPFEAAKYSGLIKDALENELNMRGAVIEKSMIAEIKKRNAPICFMKLERYYSQDADDYGKREGIVSGYFYYFKNANDIEPEKKILFNQKGNDAYGENGPLENAIISGANSIANSLAPPPAAKKRKRDK